jgi:hypothetical protein
LHQPLRVSNRSIEARSPVRSRRSAEDPGEIELQRHFTGQALVK